MARKYARGFTQITSHLYNHITQLYCCGYQCTERGNNLLKITQLCQCKIQTQVYWTAKPKLFSPHHRAATGYYLLILMHIQKHKRDFNFQLANNWIIEH